MFKGNLALHWDRFSKCVTAGDSFQLRAITGKCVKKPEVAEYVNMSNCPLKRSRQPFSAKRGRKM